MLICKERFLGNYNCAILCAMNQDQHIWRAWARAIHRWELEDWVAAFLEAAGPLTVLASQLIYIGQPVFRLAVGDENLSALARLFEEPHQTSRFIALLREDSSSEPA